MSISFLLRNDAVFDLVIHRLRDDVLLQQFIFALIGSTLYDCLGALLANALQRFQLGLSRAVEVK